MAKNSNGLVLKGERHEYAQVLRMLGDGRCEAMCIDGTKRICYMHGNDNLHVAANDIILVGLRYIYPCSRALQKVSKSCRKTMLIDGRMYLFYYSGNTERKKELKRDYKADVIHKYTPGDVGELIAYGELPENINKLNEGNIARGLEYEGKDNYIEFEDEDICQM